MAPKGGSQLFRFQLTLVFVLLVTFIGCSSGQSPVIPDTTTEQVSRNSDQNTNRTVWGYWNIRIDPLTETVNIVPDRDVAMHLNVVRLLEVEPCTDCLRISNLSCLPDNIIQCDFQLEHPFADAVKLTGFDIRGVLVTDGDTLFPVNNRFVTLDGSNPTLINPDGYTALFNPVEFPADAAPCPILGYFPGKFEFGDDFSGTLNPFMAYCKDKPRRMFEAGATEAVTINLKYASVPFEFGYVVDASWIKVSGVVDPVTDFPPEANCLEPYRLDFQMSTVLNDEAGATAEVIVEVFDHQGIETVSTVSVECPLLFDGEVFLGYSSQPGDDSWLYDGIITNEKGGTVGSYPALVRSVSQESDNNLGELAAYQVEEISVETVGPWIMVDNPNGGEVFTVGTLDEILWSSLGVTGQVKIEYTTKDGKVPIEIVGATENDGAFMWSPIPNPPTTEARVIITSIDDPAIWDQSDEQFVIAVPDSITVIQPNGGETVYDNESYEIQWEWTGDMTTVNILYSTDSGTNYDGTVVTGADCTGSYIWDTIPTIHTTQARIKVIDADNAATSDASDEDFTISIGTGEGNLFWAKRASGTLDEYSNGITTLSDDSTVVTGYFYGSTTFGPGESAETTLVSEGDADIFVVRYNTDGTIVWGKRAGGTGTYDYGNGITTLSDDSTVVTGQFYGSATFGPGESAETVLVSDGASDFFLARYNPDGTIAWAKRAGGTGGDEGFGITTLSDDSIVVTGHFQNLATFGPGESTVTVLESDGFLDIFVARYNPDGTLAWAKRAGGLNWEVGNGIATLSDDSTVVTGQFYATSTFGEGELNETVLVAGNWGDIFVARYNSNGTLAWAKKAYGPAWNYGSGITTLSDDTAVVTGMFAGSATFGEGEANETVLMAASAAADIFLARYNPDGTLAWVKNAGGTQSDKGNGITTLSGSSIVLTGYFEGTATFGEGEANETALVTDGELDIFVARYNPDGTLEWAKRAGGMISDEGIGITTLSDDSTVVTGYFQDSATFGPGESSETVLVSDGGFDIFVARFTP